MKIKIKSVLEEIAPQVFQVKDLNEAKELIKNFIDEKRIKDTDKQIIINNVDGAKHINTIHRYVANSLLKYEGLGII
jgi:6-phosphogluconate dehydrogenase